MRSWRRKAATIGAVAAALGAAAVVAEASSSARASSAVDGLTLRQLAGQRLIYSYHGLTPPEALLELIRDGEAGGVIFFGENIAGHQQIRQVTQQLQAANTQSPVKAPLLLMTDQEGGIVRRLPGEPVLSQKQIGASPHAEMLATQAGFGAGLNLLSAGMNVNLAPVLGVFRQPGDFLDQFQRSYSMDARVVARLAGRFIAAHQSTGVAATAKHFPGLGAASASENTDLVPVTLNLPLETIRGVDELPYRNAIRAGVELVMPSWALYPALDPNLPAGLSPTVIQGELRGRHGFRGVTITDAIEAGALQAFGPPPGRAVLAARAGADLVMFAARDVSLGSAGLEALVAALASGELDRVSAERAVERIIDLRSRIATRTLGPLAGLP